MAFSTSLVSRVMTGFVSSQHGKSSPVSIMFAAMGRRGGAMSEPTYEELKAKLAVMEKKGGGRRTGALDFRVGEKGGVSVYGLGRFPVTLYYEQWIRLLDVSKDLREFLEENKSAGKLKLKEPQ
jgi:hypothetical protein